MEKNHKWSEGCYGTFGATAGIQPVVQFLPHSIQHVRCDGLNGLHNLMFQFVQVCR